MTLHPRHDPERRRRDAALYVEEPIRAIFAAPDADVARALRDLADNIGEGIGTGTLARSGALAVLRAQADRAGMDYAGLEARALEVEANVRRAMNAGEVGS